ncbi:troponin I, slow skeletal muscle-like [Rhinoraja longicauda]
MFSTPEHQVKCYVHTGYLFVFKESKVLKYLKPMTSESVPAVQSLLMVYLLNSSLIFQQYEEEVIEEEETEEVDEPEPEAKPEPEPPKPAPPKYAEPHSRPLHEIIPKKSSKISASRKLHLKILMLSKAKEDLEREVDERYEEKEKFLAERVPALNFGSLSVTDLQNLCKELHDKIVIVDEERYDIEFKAGKNSYEIHDLSLKILDLRGKFKRPPLRRVRVSADAMLRALLGSKHKVSMDLRANLKSVKKDDTEKDRNAEVSDWRKNVAAKSGMEGRKKMFDASSTQ